MKTWYHAVCDKHKEICDIFVNNPIYTATILGDKSVDIQAWLSIHYNCKLRLVHHDEDLEKCWNAGYSDLFLDPLIKKK